MPYHLTYEMTPLLDKPVSKEELDAKKSDCLGACDAIVFHSIIYRPGGGRSEEIGTLDGRTGGALDETEVFKSWSMMAVALADNCPGLPEEQKKIAQDAWDAIRALVVKNRAAAPTNPQ